MKQLLILAILFMASIRASSCMEMRAHVVNYQISSGRILTVSGVGAKHVAPDQARIMINCKNFNEKPQVAYDLNEAACKKLMTILSELRIEPQDIQTSEVSVNSVYSREGQNYLGIEPSALKPL